MRPSRGSAPCRFRPTSPRGGAPDEKDRVDYQTIFAREEGAVAAPTAGLHFTPRLIEALEARGVSVHFVTLHVGAGHVPAGAQRRYRRPHHASRDGDRLGGRTPKR